MSGRAFRDFRRQANKVASDTISALAPALDDAFANEKVTRRRVETLEAWVQAFSNMSLLRRIRWFFLGK